MHESDIESFWSSNPCGDSMIGGLDGAFAGNYEEFFAAYDAFKYRLEPHIPSCIRRLDVGGQDVLEIGLGQGSESQLLIECGARWTGLDLTESSINRVRTRLNLRRLPYDDLRQGSVLDIPFPDNSFDLVFSHGVLHHVPDIDAAQAEIHRVLRPHGRLVVMLYARRSLNYLGAIAIVRRAAVLGAYPIRRRVTRGLLAQHLRNAEERGLLRYLALANFVHANTDGPANPYSKVYDKRRLAADFSSFETTRVAQHFMHAPPLPVHKLRPLEGHLGWHLWAELSPRVPPI